jgi:hypothetical protein
MRSNDERELVDNFDQIAPIRLMRIFVKEGASFTLYIEFILTIIERVKAILHFKNLSTDSTVEHLHSIALNVINVNVAVLFDKLLIYRGMCPC